ncbi:MAG: T9SS type A sorting domain-containing protein, partial [Lentimicrobiaceae bacterium]|nr:T9SS type A sorting domain-containing protein [Lentimicrobiaceae bacterium]
AGLLQLAAADFFPPQAGSTFFIDNFKFASKSSGPTFPVIGVTPTTFFEKLPDGGTAQKTISITNSGTAIGNYYSWIEYDVVPATGSGNYTLQYCGEPYTSVGYSTYVGPIEVGVKFKADQLSNKLGAKITKMSYFVPQNASLNSLIFRIYAPFSNNKPGELLKEFKKTSDIMTGDWNEITFPEPLLIDRSEFWFTVEFQQTSGAYPMSFDEIENFPVMPETNYVRQGTGSWSEFSSWGNFCITGAAQGGVIPCYLPLSGATYGTISKGTTKTINATFGASGLADGVYKATIFVPTSDENNPMFEIPCTLVKGKIAYMSVTPTSISETVSVGEDNAITVPVPITNRGTAEGTYSAAPAPADAWLSLTGDAQGTVAIDGSKTFNAVIDPTGLEKGDYEAAILVTTNDPSNGLITIACKLKVEGQGIETYINGVHTTLFPNPATDLVNVTCNKTINTIQVINYNGQIVYSAPVNDDKTTINTSNLSAGYYFVRVITDESAHSVKLIVK